MEKNKKYHIEEFFIGELYLYTHFANFTSESYHRQTNIESFSHSGAINFQPDMESRYIDWENGCEYTGFLTIFYKQGNKYICLHNGLSYSLDGLEFIENLIPLNELLPKVNTKILSTITVYRALELFDILFKSEEALKLYDDSRQPISDFFVGDIILKETYHQASNPDTRYHYIDLPHHTILNKHHLATQTFIKEDYTNVIYRCLFLKQDLDLYNLHNHQFYNPNEVPFQSIINFPDYIKEYEIQSPQDTISIPKALKLFKKTI